MNSKLSYKLTKEDEDLYVKELLQRKFLFSSRLIRQLKLVDESLCLDNVPCRLRDKGHEGQVLTCEYPEETSYFEPEDIPLDVRYEDDDLLIINKQPFLIVHPTNNYQEHTLANAITYYMQQKNETYKLRFVNRLDRDTSGLIIVAKNSHAQDFLSKTEITKKYIAIVHGEIDGDGTINKPLAKDPNHVARRMVTLDGQESITHYHVVEKISNYTKLELRLETGRTHQIRAHMSYLGHILVGDDLYGSPAFPEVFGRQALHSYFLEFTHPVTGKTVQIETDIPEDMKELWNTLKNLQI